MNQEALERIVTRRSLDAGATVAAGDAPMASQQLVRAT
jgi:hypothetical protein